MTQRTKSLEQHCSDYIASLNTVIFGRSWDLTQKTSREEAARWFAMHVDRLMKFDGVREERQSVPMQGPMGPNDSPYGLQQ